MTITVVSGGFDPIHSGHIAMIQDAAKLGDVVVLLNSDKWLTRKKGQPFMNFKERETIVSALSDVTKVFSFNDDDDSCCAGLEHIKEYYPDEKILFCNGGDRTEDNIRESNVKGVRCVFGIGGSSKMNSSSAIIANSKYLYSEYRQWGTFHNLFEDKGYKVKRMEVNPRSSLSFQRHIHRGEVWTVIEGSCTVRGAAMGDPAGWWEKTLSKDEVHIVEKGAWHQIVNDTDEMCVIIEVQYGDKTIEEDIQRIDVPQRRSISEAVEWW